ncbi:hypothetical protein SY27_12645 [Flavobacterium sp. 316]|uniref:hypothetical protein n=1 Tax=Flavobacterium sp. 316 TaxID=1603293 RepID=UPI0005DC6C5C|nr:hypothetical protein [Flavobacterium sp. 316]KIX20731.1 hypothetical protein SY27_12645 [Flavobacterium sp. 316]
MNKIYEELENLSDNGFYTKDKIVWWLDKHKLRFEKLKKDIDALANEFQDDYVRSHKGLQKEAQFLDTYEVLQEVLECYKNELYYKGQIEYYNKVKDDEFEVNSWLQLHKLDEGEIQTKFKMMFQNTSIASGYEFVIRYPFSLPVTIKFNESDFCHTIQLINLLKN